jgi:mRNA interferase RelE/StbE
MPYKVFLTKSSQREIERLPANTHNSIIKHLKLIKENPCPFGTVKLQGRDEYKFRIGSYRIIYGIDDGKKEVVIYMVDHRKQVYRRLRRK